MLCAIHHFILPVVVCSMVLQTAVPTVALEVLENNYSTPHTSLRPTIEPISSVLHVSNIQEKGSDLFCLQLQPAIMGVV